MGGSPGQDAPQGQEPDEEPTVLILLLEDPLTIFLIHLNPTNPQIQNSKSLSFTKLNNLVKQYVKQVKNKNPQAYEKYWKHRMIPAYGAEVRKNIADVVLEFHGIPRNNPEIADFLADQVWYPVKTPRQIDSSYKQMLLKISEGK